MLRRKSRLSRRRKTPKGKYCQTIHSCSLSMCRYNFCSFWLTVGLENYPSIPKFEGIETATFPIKHNWDIRSADDLPGEDILIVGGGPSSMDMAEEASITRRATNVTLATRKPHLGLPDKWGPLLPWSFGAKWLWDRSITELRVLFNLYRIFPALFVDWLVCYWSAMWARKYGIPEWKPVGSPLFLPLY
jgi:hypothetical protein